MIKLTSIEKTYQVAEKKVRALKGITASFRKAEFVCILGPSGCGKTTLLNILGGLDKYTSGDMVVGGKSTSSYSDEDWDAYRSSKVGFVFQSYNLIAHQTALENVETALTISGVSKEERRQRAIDALVKVGLSEHLRKKPRQLSGGEMQRVAIARAIVNNPSVILADEPTGALDSKNSVQIMDLLKEISMDRLVITVTHNDELASLYATRIIRISDGKILSDTNKYTPKEESEVEDKKSRSVMPYSLAAKLSFKNLVGKKVRTLLTSVAASIAIIGVALVLACSNGLNAFVDKVQKDTMSSTPVTVSTKAYNYEPYINSIFGYISSAVSGGEGLGVLQDGNVLVNHTLKNANTQYVENYITQEYLDYLKGLNPKKVIYDSHYSVKKNVYKSINVKLGTASRKVNAMVSTANNWGRIPSDSSLVFEQYDLYGKYPEAYNELALVVDKNSSISDTVLTAYFVDIFSSEKDSYTYDEIFNKYGEFSLLLNDDYYVEQSATKYTEKTRKIVDYIKEYYYKDNPGQQGFVEGEIRETLGDLTDQIYGYDVTPDDEIALLKCEKLKIVGIFKLKEDTQYGIFSASPICYPAALDDFIMTAANGGEFDGTNYSQSKVIKAQMSSPEKNVVSGEKLDGGKLSMRIALKDLGYTDAPSSIKFYPKTIKDKDYLTDYLKAYNDGKAEGEKITYTDNVGVAIELVRSIIGGVSAILVALTSVSLIVSGIMIAIITYVSVIERTKEIGILRSVGARKKDVVRLFVTETGMIGLTAGVTGILATLILTLPLNVIFKGITGVKNLIFVSLGNVFILIAVSILLTVIAGLVPSLMAGRADPVKALRSE